MVIQIQISDEICPKDYLKMLKLQNLNKIVIGHLKINSIRNKFEFLEEIVGENIDILIVSESKIDETFHIGQFTMHHYHTSFREDRNGKWGGLILFICDHIPCRRIHLDFYLKIEAIIIEKNLR